LIGAMLIEGGAISEEQLSEALLALQRQLLAGVLLWRTGAFRFMADERLPDHSRDALLGSDGRLESMLQSIMDIAEREQRFEAPPPEERAA
jgi:hypothetical protein